MESNIDERFKKIEFFLQLFSSLVMCQFETLEERQLILDQLAAQLTEWQGNI